jgi:hypothetical protein
VTLTNVAGRAPTVTPPAGIDPGKFDDRAIPGELDDPCPTAGEDRGKALLAAFAQANQGAAFTASHQSPASSKIEARTSRLIQLKAVEAPRWNASRG